MARITDLVDENGELLYPISVLGAIYKDNQTAEQWVEGLTNTLNTKIDTHVLEDITSENGVHGIRYYNDVLSYKNMFGEWVEITTSGGNTPTPPTPTETPLGEPNNASLTNVDESVVIMWTDPEDVDTSVWKGTVVVRKEGSVPTDKSDGIIVVDSRTRNQYATSGYTDTGLTNGTEYFYGIFPYTTNETYTNTYTTSITPSAIYPSAPTNVSVEAGDSQISISFTTPSDATGTRIVWGTSAPTDENYGNTINNVSSPFMISDLNNGTTYYVQVYSYNDKARFTGSDVVSATPNIPVQLVPWSTGTDEQIVAMVNAYYNDEITLDDVKSVWSVGDAREMEFSAIPAQCVEVSEGQETQKVEIVIIDFNHNDLYETVNGKSKALITVQLKDCLNNYGNLDPYIDAFATGEFNGWFYTRRYYWADKWCYESIPLTIRDSIKKVKSYFYYYIKSDSTYITSYGVSNCFLLSEYEIFGNKNYINIEEGYQYEYYKNTSNRIKSNATWWTRSNIDTSHNFTKFCIVKEDGTEGYDTITSSNGICPAFCL